MKTFVEKLNSEWKSLPSRRKTLFKVLMQLSIIIVTILMCSMAFTKPNKVLEQPKMRKVEISQEDLLRYMKRQKEVSSCVENYLIFRNVEMVYLSGATKEQVLEMLNKENPAEPKKQAIKDAIDMVYNLEKIGMGEYTLMNCLRTKPLIV